MRAPSLTSAVYLCATLTGAIAPACASSSGAGSETHFVCAGDSDCNAGAVCVESRCVARSSNVLDAGGGRGPVEAPTKDGGAMEPVVESGARGADPSLFQAACPSSASTVPLDDGCTDAVCYAVLRLDYLTLAPRGWASIGGPIGAIDASTAKTTAAGVFASDCMDCSGTPPSVTGPYAGLYYASISPTDFGAFALVGAQSGLVVTAGSVIWAGRGNYYIPAMWKSASDIRCGMNQIAPAETFEDASDGCETTGGKSGADASDALALAMRTNLAQGYAQKGPYAAYVFLYMPAMGACDASVAEWVVVLSR